MMVHGNLPGGTITWKAGWDSCRWYRSSGIGAKGYRRIVSRVLAEQIRLDERDPAPPAHNTFLSVLVEQGVVGFAVFCALLGVLALSLRSLPHFQQRLWIVSLAVWLVGVSSLTWEMRKPTWFFFGLLMAQCGSMVPERSVQSLARRFTQARLNLRWA